MDGYVSKAEGLTVADLRTILEGAQPNEPVELVTMFDGSTQPIVAAMLSEEQPTRLYLYTEID